jgi:hypothetical protein
VNADAVQQQVLPEFEPRALRRVRKEVRKVSRANLYHLKDTGELSQRVVLVLNGLAHYYYVTQDWPTPAEVTRWLYRHSKIVRESVNIVAPRISDLVNGETRRKVVNGVKTRVRVGGGACELLPKRTCTVTGGDAHPVRIREAGSVLARFGYGGLF